MNTLFFFIRKNRRLVTLSCLFGLVGGALNAFTVALIGDQISTAEGQLTISLAWYGALVLCMFLVGAASRLVVAWLAENLMADLRLTLCEQIATLPLRDIERQGIPKFVASFTDDLNHVSESLIQLPNVFINAAIVAGCLIYLGMLSLPIFLTLMLFLLVSVVGYLIPDRYGQIYIKKSREKLDELHQHFNALTYGSKELKLNRERRDAFLGTVLRPAIMQLRGFMLRFRAFYAILLEWVHLLYFLFIGALFVGFANLSAYFQAGAIAVFAVVVLYIRTPVIQMVNVLPLLRRASVALQAVDQLGLDFTRATGSLTEFAVTDIAAVPATMEPPRRIALHGLTYTYFHEREDEQFTLGPIDLEIAAGEVIFIVGGNGSGKTSLAKLITGLYTPESGHLSVDGEVIDDHNREDYRQHFSAVFSDFYLFDRIFGEGVDCLDKRTSTYLKELHLDHKVRIEGGRFSTLSLSAGQRKRLALLAAYMEDRPIYLFDEWAADQDPEFKDVFYRVLVPELKKSGKTALIISHDDRYFDAADRILKLADGQLEHISQSDKLASV